MAHLVRILTDAQLRRGFVLTGTHLAGIDANTKKAMNGAGGGTGSPAGQVSIGGAGVIVAGRWIMSGAGVTVTTAEDAPITFAKGDGSDYFGYALGHPGRSPSVRTCFVEYSTDTPYEVVASGTLLRPAWLGARFRVPIAVYSGASQIDTVAVDWAVAEAHANIPQYLPRMRVFAVSSDGTETPLREEDATTDAQGFQFLPTPASGAAYYALGATKTWTYTCNVALPVDASTHRFFIEFIEESGTDSWAAFSNQYISALTSFSDVGIFDGRH